MQLEAQNENGREREKDTLDWSGAFVQTPGYQYTLEIFQEILSISKEIFSEIYRH